MARVVILSQGDEVTSGQIVDTNAAWLSERVQAAGHTVVLRATARDDVAEIAEVLRIALRWGDIVLSSGGLGPTIDDLTASAAALALGRPLRQDQDAIQSLKAVAARRGRSMTALWERMALLPEGASIFSNPVGVAPGFSLEEGGVWMAFLPGVPSEMRAIFNVSIFPQMLERSVGQPLWVQIETTGLGESRAQEALRAVDLHGMSLHFRAKEGSVQVKLRGEAGLSGDIGERVTRDVLKALRPHVFSWTADGRDPSSLAEVVGAHLLLAGQRVAVAESCTGGRVAALCTAVPGASHWFQAGVVSYSEESKQSLLGVSGVTLREYGAVSPQVAAQMAAGARALGADWGLATTGVAGPDGGTEASPVGTVWIALEGPLGAYSRRFEFSGSRDDIQTAAAYAALDMLRQNFTNEEDE